MSASGTKIWKAKPGAAKQGERKEQAAAKSSGQKPEPNANLDLQKEEVEALKSIYGEEIACVQPQPVPAGVLSAASLLLNVPNDVEGRRDTPLQVQVFLPSSYPSSEPPVAVLSAEWLAEERTPSLCAELLRIYNSKRASNGGVGEVVLFEWVEWLRESVVPPQVHVVDHGESVALALALQRMELKAAREEGEATSERGPIDGTNSDGADHEAAGGGKTLLQLRSSLGLVSGEVVVDRKSTFQAHVAPVQSVAQVKAVMAALLSDRKIARATHNIMAYRIVNEESGVIIRDNDEDGEEAAGGRLAHLLDVLPANNVIVVVSRWFGGILLGPDRFKHINNTARLLLEQQGYSRSADTGKSANVKTGKHGKPR